jgi:PAS domain S-box-containing protein
MSYIDLTARLRMNIPEVKYRVRIDAIPTMAWCSLPDGSVEFFNQRWHDYTGVSFEKARGWGWKTVIHPDDLETVMDKWRALLASGQPGEIEARLRRFDGEYRWFLARAEPVRDNLGEIVNWYGADTDIEDRKRAEALLVAEKRTLEMIAGGAPLADILESLCDTIDAQSPKIISTANLMDPDGKRLWNVAGHRIPRGWIEAITPLMIGANVGSCGTAAALKQRVVVSDIATDPLWADYRELALAHGLRAAWSQPLLSKDHEMLGTFAMYYGEPRTPSESDLQLIEGAGHVAVIAIEGERARAALAKAVEEIKKSEAQFRTIIDAIPQLIIAIGTDGKFLYTNRAVLEYTGLTKEEVMSESFGEVFHPEDTERLRDERDAAISREVPFEYERRMRGKDGQYRWLLVHYRPLRDEAGNVIRWYATGTDIDDRKQAEERTRQENFACERKSITLRCSRKSLAPLRHFVRCWRRWQKSRPLILPSSFQVRSEPERN